MGNSNNIIHSEETGTLIVKSINEIGRMFMCTEGGAKRCMTHDQNEITNFITQCYESRTVHSNWTYFASTCQLDCDFIGEKNQRNGCFYFSPKVIIGETVFREFSNIVLKQYDLPLKPFQCVCNGYIILKLDLL